MIPLWLKISYTLYTAITVIVYARKYGPGNFLWFSDIALLVTVPAIWLESSLLASMMALGVLVPEILWNLSYFIRLLTGLRITGLADYMFDDRRTLYVRALSLFHIFLPILLIWMVARLGYTAAALPAQTLLAWIVLPLTWRLTDPKQNINWTRGLRQPQKHLPPLVYLALIMLAFPLLIYIPTHLVLSWIWGR